jgi:hypothetical protein
VIALFFTDGSISSFLYDPLEVNHHIFLLFLVMVIQCLDLLLGCLTYVVLHELILICVVLVLFMLTTIKLIFVFYVFWLIKLILMSVNFVT